MSHMPLGLPLPASTPDLQLAPGDLTWAATFNPSPLPPVTILGTTSTTLHHPQLRSVSSGTMLTFPTVPTSPPIVVHLDTEPHPHRATDTPHHGTSPYQPHLSLYKKSRNLLPAPQPPISTHQGAATGRTSRSSVHHNASRVIPHDQPQGSDSPGNSNSNNGNYSRPLSHNMDVPQ